jgi:hypothetical protein
MKSNLNWIKEFEQEKERVNSEIKDKENEIILLKSEINSIDSLILDLKKHQQYTTISSELPKDHIIE